MNEGHDVIVDRMDQFVFDMGQLAGADEAASIVFERGPDERAAVLEGAAEERQRFGARGLDRARVRVERGDFRAHAGAIEQLRGWEDWSAASPRGNCFEHGVKHSD
jgi:hypothetical protein